MNDENNNEKGKKLNVLDDIMQTIRFRGTIFFHSKLAAPWGVSFQSGPAPRFHIALSGNCFVGTSGPAFQLNSAEIAMVPGGHQHWVADQPNSPLADADQVGEACQLNSPMFQNGEITHTLMCGMIQYDQDTPHPIFDAMPEVLVFSEQLIHEATWNTVRIIDAEIQRKGNNSSPIVDRLTEALFLQLLESYAEKNDQKIGFFAALSDPRLKLALKLIHSNPEFNWTLSKLGQRIGMSKATLNRHFQHTLGVSPITYIKNWKMMKALNMIRYTNAGLDQVAEAVGFSSSRTLNKAFHQHYGQTPSQARKAS